MAENGTSGNVLEHLEALRSVLIRTAVTFALLCIPGWCLAPWLIRKLLAYAAPEGFKLHYFTLMEPFCTQIKCMVALAVLGTFPFALCWFWGFVSPGLTTRERRLLRLPVLAAMGLALSGMAVAVAFLIPAVVQFSLTFSGAELAPVLGIGDFVGLMLMIVLAGALMFQFPLVVYALLALNIATLEGMKKKRAVILVLILIVAALVTPPDVVSQLLLAVPSYLLFEGTLLLFCFRRKHGTEE